MWFLVTLMVIAAAAALWHHLVSKTKYWSNMGVNQSKPKPLFGDGLEVALALCSSAEFLRKLYNIQPNARYIGCYNFTAPVLMLRDPELIKQISIKDFEHFPDHADFVDPDSDPLWSRNLFALKGERWREMRHVMSPTFTSSKIKLIYKLITEVADSFVQYFEGTVGDGVLEVDVKDTFSRFTNDVIASTAFGIQVDSFRNQDNSFYRVGKHITNFSGFFNTVRFLALQVAPKLCKALGMKFFDDATRRYLTETIGQAIKLRKEKNIVRPDIIQILLEASGKEGDTTEKGKRPLNISTDDITSQAAIFFFAGFDTVSTAICFAAYELAINKEVQDKLREEFRACSQNGKATYDELQQMHYLDMVVSEVLRKWPPTPFLDRVCKTPYTIEPKHEGEQTVVIPADMEVWLPIYALHRDPKYYPEPEKFDPERFSAVNKSSINASSYMPFGIGPRACIGNRFALIEIKALLFNLLNHFEIMPVEKTPIPLVLESGIQVAIRGGCWIGFKKIETQTK